MIALDDYIRLFEVQGGTDVDYLRNHWPRFRSTKEIFERGRPMSPALRVLDVGAHWLHQSLLFALDGYRVTAADLPDTIDAAGVVNLARAHGIQLLAYRDLADPNAFSGLPDASFDVIVFGEILEHLAFNPTGLWREIHRLMEEGGTLIVTTPNYYALTRRRAREWRVLTGGGAGITVAEILTTPTHGHHWKEYSRREVERYFGLLSPDFVVTRLLHVEDEPAAGASRPQRLMSSIRKCFPPLRSRLHVEIGLPRKVSGIVIEPRWYPSPARRGEED